MANTIKTYVSDGSTTIYTFEFVYIHPDFVTVLVDAAEVGFTLTGTYQITLDAAPVTDDVIIIQRITSADRIVDFTNGSVLVAKDLNVSALQAMHIAEEAYDKAAGSLLINDAGAYTAGFRKIADLGDPTGDRDAVNKQWAETALTSQLAQATAAKDTAVAAESNSVTQATAAGVSAATASGKATEAASSAVLAGNAATDAANYAATANTHATTAGTHAGTAAAQATTATDKAGEAATSAVSADTAKVGAEAARDQIVGIDPLPKSGGVITGPVTYSTPHWLGDIAAGTVTLNTTGKMYKSLGCSGAFTLEAPGGTDCYEINVYLYMNSGAGAITFSGFTKVTGDALTTTAFDRFFLRITRIGNFINCDVTALQ